ncbi:MAG: hypothetical protein JWM49_666 [Microbacteriaceae bacterium]|nr:hypothetical protein [Microbacteriaceae bacterium]
MAAEKPDSASRQPTPKPEAKPPDAGWSTRRKVLVAAAAAVLLAGGITATVLTSLGAPGSDRQAGPPQSGAPASPKSSDTSATPTSPDPAATPTSPDPAATPGPAVPAAPVALDKPAQIEPGLSAAITKFEAVDGKALTPGEVSAPSVRTTVTIRNASSESVPLTTAVVTAYYGPDQTPALELTSPGGAPFPTKVAAGQSATAVYLFSIPVDQRDRVRIVVDYSVKVSPVVFEGAVPR